MLLALLRQGVELTVCLTVDSLESRNELYALSRISARRLLAAARELGQKVELRTMEAQEGRAPALRWFSEEMFRYGAARFEGGEVPVRLRLAESLRKMTQK